LKRLSTQGGSIGIGAPVWAAAAGQIKKRLLQNSRPKGALRLYEFSFTASLGHQFSFA
jgi:hypothetical protein